MSESASPRGVEVHPQVLHETIEGEVIVIDLATGAYFSMRDSAALIWDVLQGAPGATPTELARAIDSHYVESADAIVEAIEEFVDRLEGEGLVRRADGSRSSKTIVAPLSGSSAAVFGQPRLEKYTDMQDLVLLDPVHEVGEAGWPQARPEAPSGT